MRLARTIDGRPEVRLDAARAALSAGLSGRGDLVAITVPAPIGAPDTLLRVLPLGWGTLWQPAEGPRFAGVGAAAVLAVEGPDRFGALRRRTRALFDALATTGPAPRLFGGVAFAPGPQGEAWRGFGDGCFTLPRWTWRHDDDGAWLTLVATPGDRAALDELDAIWAALTAAPPPEPPPVAATLRQLDPAVWTAYVEAIRDAIRSGVADKIVAAREAIVEAAEPLDALAVARRLRADQPGCHVFAFQRPESTFLGATPEHLFRKRGAALRTHALAGSVQAGPTGEALLSSDKDLWEHRVVVREILDRIGPLVRDVRCPDRPALARVRDLFHLDTPIEAVLGDDVHPVDVLEALHPTPAVGGYPREEAVRFILDHEPAPRGWYAGAVGWLDAAGDAELVVAIRSGLVEARRARVYAGAGIVLASDPAAEYAETALKQRPLLRALGVAP